MKKSIAVLLALVFMIGAVFFGCGKKEENPDSTTETTETRNQQEVNALEDELSKQTLVMISNEFLKKDADGNTLGKAAVRASIMNASEKTVTYAVIAFGLWDSEDKPISVSKTSDGKDEYITRYSYMALKVPAGNIFGSEVLIPVADEIGERVAYIKAIPVSCTFDDGTNWVNPHYEDFMKIYDGKTFIESDKGSNSAAPDNKEENTTTTKTSDGNNDTGTTKDNGNQNSGSTDNNQNNNQGNTQNGNQGSSEQGADKSEYLVTKCIDTFAKGTYKMTVVTDPGTADEATFTMAVKNGNMSMTTTMDSIEATMLYNAGEDTTYMLFDSIKMYTDVTEDMMGGDMDMSELTKEFNLSVPNKVTVSQSVFNGKNVRCESFVDAGIQSNYYFDASGNFVGREDFNTDGTVTAMVISGFTDRVDDSMFEIPKGYHYVNLSWIMALMGE